MADHLITWVDVEQELRAEFDQGRWPPGLRAAEAYWTGVRLYLESPEHKVGVESWLREVFARHLQGDDSAWHLKLDSEVSLPIDFDLDVGSLPEPRYLPSFTRPTLIPGPVATAAEDVGDEFYEPTLVAFHSYKGGVGRTTHALSFALEIVKRTGGKVLLVDGDFEAPGLSWHIRERYPKPEISYADLLILAHGDENPSAEGSVDAVATALKNQESNGMYVLPCFRESFRWEGLDVRPDHLMAGRSAFAVSELLVSLGSKLGVEAIVVDLRAGLSELSAGLLLDPRMFRVLVTSMGEQSLRGVEKVADNLRDRVGARSSATTHFIISHVPTVLRDSAQLDAARESLTSAISGPTQSLDEGEVSEVIVTEYDVDLVTLPLEWERTLAMLEQAGLPKSLAVLVERSPISSEVRTIAPSDLALPAARRKLAELAEQQIFAETGEATGFLRIEPLTRLAQDHRTRLPVAVVTGAKGAGKTYTFFQLMLAKTWSSFSTSALGGSLEGSEAHLVSLVEPRNITEAARSLLAKRQEEHNAIFGGDGIDAGELRDRIQAKVESKDDAVTRWRSFWLDAMAWRVGCAVEEEGAGQALAEYLRSRELRVIFVIDGLEDLFQDFQDDETERLALRALVQELPERIARVASDEVGLVILVRPDLVHAAVPQNTQQFLARYKPYAIRWSPDSALKLAIWLAVEAGALELKDGAPAVASLPQARIAELLLELWGSKLGSAKSKEARSQAWVIGVLSDFQGQIQARDVVRFVHYAAGRSAAREDSRFTDRLLDPRAMRDALKDWGEEKIGELGEEDKRLKEIFTDLKKATHDKKKVPFEADNLGLEQDRIDYLSSRGIIYDDNGKIYIAELVRIGLGFEMGNGARPRIVSLRRKIFQSH